MCECVCECVSVCVSECVCVCQWSCPGVLRIQAGGCGVVGSWGNGIIPYSFAHRCVLLPCRHSLVPVVPERLLEMVQLPSIYIMGMHSSHRGRVEEMVLSPTSLSFLSSSLSFSLFKKIQTEKVQCSYMAEFYVLSHPSSPLPLSPFLSLSLSPSPSLPLSLSLSLPLPSLPLPPG